MGVPTIATDHRASTRRRRIWSGVARQSDRHRGNPRTHDGRGENIKGKRVRLRIGRLIVRISATKGGSTSERDQIAGRLHHTRSSCLPHHRICGVWLIAVSMYLRSCYAFTDYGIPA